MTAPDDLARDEIERLLGEHTPVTDWLCACGWRSDGKTGHRAHLASVVSRRDTDLRTRIEKLMAVADFEVGDGYVATGDLKGALGGDMREDAEFRYVDSKTGEPCPTRPNGPVGLVLCTITDKDHRHVAAHMWNRASRVPADTDTGR